MHHDHLDNALSLATIPLGGGGAGDRVYCVPILRSRSCLFVRWCPLPQNGSLGPHSLPCIPFAPPAGSTLSGLQLLIHAYQVSVTTAIRHALHYPPIR